MHLSSKLKKKKKKKKKKQICQFLIFIRQNNHRPPIGWKNAYNNLNIYFDHLCSYCHNMSYLRNIILFIFSQIIWLFFKPGLTCQNTQGISQVSCKSYSVKVRSNQNNKESLAKIFGLSSGFTTHIPSLNSNQNNRAIQYIKPSSGEWTGS
jgi:hypothetical protein